MTNPATIVLAHIEIVVVAKLETGMAKLAITAIDRLLRKFQMPFQIDIRILFSINLEKLGNEYLNDVK